jgi:SAM-dependent methyltransferase
MRDIASLMAQYPRARPSLPDANADLYVEEYKINRGVGTHSLYRLTAWLESWMHHQVATAPGTCLLEIGAGTLNHRSYEKDAARYDIVEPLADLYKDSAQLSRITKIYKTIEDVPRHTPYDRIFSVAVLEHLQDLPTVVAACALRLAPNGIFQAGIPAEGGFLWGLAWRTTTGLSYRLRTGLPYGPVMRHEHINSAAEIIAIVRLFFANVQLRWFPLPSRHLAFYCYIEARTPILQHCLQAVR